MGTYLDLILDLGNYRHVQWVLFIHCLINLIAKTTDVVLSTQKMGDDVDELLASIFEEELEAA